MYPGLQSTFHMAIYPVIRNHQIQPHSPFKLPALLFTGQEKGGKKVLHPKNNPTIVIFFVMTHLYMFLNTYNWLEKVKHVKIQ